MSPFQVQMINFTTIMSGSILSTVLMPQICGMIGESAAVGIIDCISVLLYFIMLAMYGFSNDE